MTARNLLSVVVRFSKKIIILSVISVITFSAAMIFVYIFTGGVPDTLISEFMGFFRLEGGVLGLIKIAEIVVEKLIPSKTKSENGKSSGAEDFPELPITNLDDIKLDIKSQNEVKL